MADCHFQNYLSRFENYLSSLVCVRKPDKAPKFLCLDFILSFLPKIWCSGATIQLSFSKEEFNHRKCRSTASSLSMPLLPISVHKGIAIASHFARGLCTPQPQCWL